MNMAWTFVALATFTTWFGLCAASPRPSPPLSPFVAADLAKRDPATYQLFDQRSQFTSHVDNVRRFHKRSAPNGLDGLQTACFAEDCIVYTFDDGPFDEHKKVIDTAVENNVKITYFVNVNNYDCIYNESRVEALRYSYGKGAQICSHTATHPHLNELTHDQIDRQVQKVEDALYKILGVVPACLRPPYGEANDDVVNYLNNRWGLVVLNWNVDTRDSLGASVNESLDIIRDIKPPMKANILSHETIPTSVDELFPQAISILKDNGYSSDNFVTVAEGFGFNAYKVVGQRSERDDTWTCDGLVPGQG